MIGGGANGGDIESQHCCARIPSPLAEGVSTARGSRRQSVRAGQASATSTDPGVTVIDRRRRRKSVETDRTGAWRGQRVLPDRPTAAHGRR